MNYYLIACGIALNIALVSALALVLWVWFIWPFVEAISLTRCWAAAFFHRDTKKSGIEVIKQFFSWYKRLLFGRTWTRISNRYFEWEGVGNWKVYQGEE